MTSVARLETAIRSGLDAFKAARLSDERGADLSQWGILSSTMAGIAKDATDKRRRPWRMKLPAKAAALIATAAAWFLLARHQIPEAERSSFDVVFFAIWLCAGQLLNLAARWRLESRVAQARRVISRPIESGAEPFYPAHVLTIDDTMVAAIDAEGRLVRVIAPVFSGLDVVFRVDARIRRVRLAKPKLVDFPAVADMPKVSADLHYASALTIQVDGGAEPALFFIAYHDVSAAVEWTNVLQRWMQEDIAWQKNLNPTPVRGS